MVTRRETIDDVWRRLKSARVDSPRLTAELLLSHVLRCDRTELVTSDHKELSVNESDELARLVERRVSGEPVAYILEEREFFGLSFRVNPSVLIPRPETELIVEWGLELLHPIRQPKVLDIGVGSGCILASLLRERPDAFGVGIDISEAAASTAAHNLARLNVSDRGWVAVGDGASAILPSTSFQLITNNPPYILPEEASQLSREVLEREPSQALFCSAEDPFREVRALAEASRRLLRPGGVLLVEAGAGRHEGVADAMRSAGLDRLRVRDDLAGIPRVVAGRRST